MSDMNTVLQLLSLAARFLESALSHADKPDISRMELNAAKVALINAERLSVGQPIILLFGRG